MASLRKRGGQFWISYNFEGKRYRKPLGTNNERVAKSKLKQLEYELALGELQVASRLPLKTILEAFCGDLAATRTYKSYKNDYSRLRIFFGPICEALKPSISGVKLGTAGSAEGPDRYAGKHVQAEFLEDITAQVINRFLAARERQNNWAPKTVNLMRQKGSLQRLIDEMDGSAKAADLAEQAQNEAARIIDYSRRYACLRLASAVLQQEIERYREANQGPILQRAGEMFAALTLGSFARLRSDFGDGDNPILLGERPSGEAVGVEAMSDGTRDQLYLSLRLSCLEKILDDQEPIPFIVDDILINFDNQRSAATLKLLAELSKRTQVIFFTHHNHLVDLANSVVGDGALQVQSLGAS